MTPPDWKDEHAPASPITGAPPAAAETAPAIPIRLSTFDRAIDAVALLQLAAQRARQVGLYADLEVILLALRAARAKVGGRPCR